MFNLDYEGIRMKLFFILSCVIFQSISFASQPHATNDNTNLLPTSEIASYPVLYTAIPGNKILGLFGRDVGQQGSIASLKLISQDNKVEAEFCGIPTYAYQPESIVYFDDLKKAYIKLRDNFHDHDRIVEVSMTNHSCNDLDFSAYDNFSQMVRISNHPEFLAPNPIWIDDFGRGAGLYKYNANTGKNEILFQSKLENAFQLLSISQDSSFIGYWDKLNDTTAKLVIRSLDKKVVHEFAPESIDRDFNYAKLQFCTDNKRAVSVTKNGFKVIDLKLGNVIKDINIKVSVGWDEDLHINSSCTNAVFVEGNDRRDNLTILRFKDEKKYKVIDDIGGWKVLNVSDDFTYLKILQFNYISEFKLDASDSYFEKVVVSDIKTDYPMTELSSYVMNKEKTKIWITGRNSWTGRQALWEVDLTKSNAFKNLGLIDYADRWWTLQMSNDESRIYFKDYYTLKSTTL